MSPQRRLDDPNNEDRDFLRGCLILGAFVVVVVCVVAAGVVLA